MQADQTWQQNKPESGNTVASDDQKMVTISAVIVTLNEEENLPRCLESLEWCDEIIVVDSHSTDRTREIASEYGAKVYERDWDDKGHQWNYGFQQVSSDWVLHIDADEVVPDGLRKEIETVVAADCDNSIDICRIPLLTNFLGNWSGRGRLRCVRGWLFRRAYARYVYRYVHEGTVISDRNGREVVLTNPMLHYSYKDLTDYLARFNRYTSWEVDKYAAKWGDQRWFYLRWAYRTLRAFADRYIRWQGFRDGLHGFIWAVLCSFYVFMWHAKYWEKYMNPLAAQTKNPPPNEVSTTANDAHTF